MSENIVDTIESDESVTHISLLNSNECHQYNFLNDSIVEYNETDEVKKAESDNQGLDSRSLSVYYSDENVAKSKRSYPCSEASETARSYSSKLPRALKKVHPRLKQTLGDFTNKKMQYMAERKVCELKEKNLRAMFKRLLELNQEISQLKGETTYGALNVKPPLTWNATEDTASHILAVVKKQSNKVSAAEIQPNKHAETAGDTIEIGSNLSLSYYEEVKMKCVSHDMTVKELLAANDHLRAENQNLQKMLEEAMEEQTCETKQAPNHASTSWLETTRLTEENEKLKIDIEAVQKERQSLIDEITSVQLLIDHLEADKSRLMAESAVMACTNKALSAKIEALEKDVLDVDDLGLPSEPINAPEGIESPNSSTKENVVPSSQIEKDEYIFQIESLSESVASLGTDKAKLMLESAALNERTKHLSEEIERLKSDELRYINEILVLTESLKDQKDSESQIRNLTSQTNSLSKTVQLLEREKGNLMLEVERMNVAHQEMEAELDNWKNEKTKYHSDVNSLTNVINSLKEENASFSLEVVTMNNTNHNLREEIAQLRIEQQKYIEEIATLKTSLAAMETVKANLAEEVDTINEINETMKIDCQKLKMENDEAQLEISTLNELKNSWTACGSVVPVNNDKNDKEETSTNRDATITSNDPSINAELINLKSDLGEGYSRFIQEKSLLMTDINRLNSEKQQLIKDIGSSKAILDKLMNSDLRLPMGTDGDSDEHRSFRSVTESQEYLKLMLDTLRKNENMGELIIEIEKLNREKEENLRKIIELEAKINKLTEEKLSEASSLSAKSGALLIWEEELTVREDRLSIQNNISEARKGLLRALHSSIQQRKRFEKNHEQ